MHCSYQICHASQLPKSHPSRKERFCERTYILALITSRFETKDGGWYTIHLNFLYVLWNLTIRRECKIALGFCLTLHHGIEVHQNVKDYRVREVVEFRAGAGSRGGFGRKWRLLLYYGFIRLGTVVVACACLHFQRNMMVGELFAYVTLFYTLKFDIFWSGRCCVTLV